MTSQSIDIKSNQPSAAQEMISYTAIQHKLSSFISGPTFATLLSKLSTMKQETGPIKSGEIAFADFYNLYKQLVGMYPNLKSDGDLTAELLSQALKLNPDFGIVVESNLLSTMKNLIGGTIQLTNPYEQSKVISPEKPSAFTKLQSSVQALRNRIKSQANTKSLNLDAIKVNNKDSRINGIRRFFEGGVRTVGRRFVMMAFAVGTLWSGVSAIPRAMAANQANRPIDPTELSIKQGDRLPPGGLEIQTVKGSTRIVGDQNNIATQETVAAVADAAIELEIAREDTLAGKAKKAVSDFFTNPIGTAAEASETDGPIVNEDGTVPPLEVYQGDVASVTVEEPTYDAPVDVAVEPDYEPIQEVHIEAAADQVQFVEEAPVTLEPVDPNNFTPETNFGAVEVEINPEVDPTNVTPAVEATNQLTTNGGSTEAIEVVDNTVEVSQEIEGQVPVASEETMAQLNDGGVVVQEVTTEAVLPAYAFKVPNGGESRQIAQRYIQELPDNQIYNFRIETQGGAYRKVTGNREDINNALQEIRGGDSVATLQVESRTPNGAYLDLSFEITPSAPSVTDPTATQVLESLGDGPAQITEEHANYSHFVVNAQNQYGQISDENAARQIRRIRASEQLTNLEFDRLADKVISLLNQGTEGSKTEALQILNEQRNIYTNEIATNDPQEAEFVRRYLEQLDAMREVVKATQPTTGAIGLELGNNRETIPTNISESQPPISLSPEFKAQAKAEFIDASQKFKDVYAERGGQLTDSQISSIGASELGKFDTLLENGNVAGARSYYEQTVANEARELRELQSIINTINRVGSPSDREYVARLEIAVDDLTKTSNKVMRQIDAQITLAERQVAQRPVAPSSNTGRFGLEIQTPTQTSQAQAESGVVTTGLENLNQEKPSAPILSLEQRIAQNIKQFEQSIYQIDGYGPVTKYANDYVKVLNEQLKDTKNPEVQALVLRQINEVRRIESERLLNAGGYRDPLGLDRNASISQPQSTRVVENNPTQPQQRVEGNNGQTVMPDGVMQVETYLNNIPQDQISSTLKQLETEGKLPNGLTSDQALELIIQAQTGKTTEARLNAQDSETAEKELEGITALVRERINSTEDTSNSGLVSSEEIIQRAKRLQEVQVGGKSYQVMALLNQPIKQFDGFEFKSAELVSPINVDADSLRPVGNAQQTPEQLNLLVDGTYVSFTTLTDKTGRIYLQNNETKQLVIPDKSARQRIDADSKFELKRVNLKGETVDVSADEVFADGLKPFSYDEWREVSDTLFPEPKRGYEKPEVTIAGIKEAEGVLLSEFGDDINHVARVRPSNINFESTLGTAVESYIFDKYGAERAQLYRTRVNEYRAQVYRSLEGRLAINNRNTLHQQGNVLDQIGINAATGNYSEVDNLFANLDHNVAVIAATVNGRETVLDASKSSSVREGSQGVTSELASVFAGTSDEVFLRQAKYEFILEGKNLPTSFSRLSAENKARLADIQERHRAGEELLPQDNNFINNVLVPRLDNDSFAERAAKIAERQKGQLRDSHIEAMSPTPEALAQAKLDYVLNGNIDALIANLSDKDQEEVLRIKQNRNRGIVLTEQESNFLSERVVSRVSDSEIMNLNPNLGPYNSALINSKLESWQKFGIDPLQSILGGGLFASWSKTTNFAMGRVPESELDTITQTTKAVAVGNVFTNGFVNGVIANAGAKVVLDAFAPDPANIAAGKTQRAFGVFAWGGSSSSRISDGTIGQMTESLRDGGNPLTVIADDSQRSTVKASFFEISRINGAGFQNVDFENNPELVGLDKISTLGIELADNSDYVPQELQGTMSNSKARELRFNQIGVSKDTQTQRMALKDVMKNKDLAEQLFQKIVIINAEGEAIETYATLNWQGDKFEVDVVNPNGETDIEYVVKNGVAYIISKSDCGDNTLADIRIYSELENSSELICMGSDCPPGTVTYDELYQRTGGNRVAEIGEQTVELNRVIQRESAAAKISNVLMQSAITRSQHMDLGITKAVELLESGVPVDQISNQIIDKEALVGTNPETGEKVYLHDVIDAIAKEDPAAATKFIETYANGIATDEIDAIGYSKQDRVSVGVSILFGFGANASGSGYEFGYLDTGRNVDFVEDCLRRSLDIDLIERLAKKYSWALSIKSKKVVGERQEPPQEQPPEQPKPPEKPTDLVDESNPQVTNSADSGTQSAPDAAPNGPTAEVTNTQPTTFDQNPASFNPKTPNVETAIQTPAVPAQPGDITGATDLPQTIPQIPGNPLIQGNTVTVPAVAEPIQGGLGPLPQGNIVTPPSIVNNSILNGNITPPASVNSSFADLIGEQPVLTAPEIGNIPGL